jgi:hypothetical protein
VSRLKIKIPGKNLGRQICAEGFNSGAKGLNFANCMMITEEQDVYCVFVKAKGRDYLLKWAEENKETCVSG